MKHRCGNSNWIWLVRAAREAIAGSMLWMFGGIVVQAELTQQDCLNRCSSVLIQSGVDLLGNPVNNAYDEDRRLVRAQIGVVALNYNYSRVGGLLAYAITDNGAIYTVSRDRLNRIVQIGGARSTLMKVAYQGISTIPSYITVELASGQTVTPYDRPSGDHAIDRSISSVDQTLTQVYEAYAFSSCAPGFCSWTN